MLHLDYGGAWQFGFWKYGQGYMLETIQSRCESIYGNRLRKESVMEMRLWHGVQILRQDLIS
ncbi:hypothetical protein ABH19_00135 [Leptospirillum sp. Group II 'CF-1']|nr:hypothetical protein ABH19_00135 [Leptospirillum sp. Group II 'CF-1']